MTKWYYYDTNGIKQGLIDDSKLKILAAHGIVKPDTLIETEDGKTATANKIKGLEFSDQKNIIVETFTPIPHRTIGVENRHERATRRMAWAFIILLVILVIPSYLFSQYLFSDGFNRFSFIAKVGLVCTGISIVAYCVDRLIPN